MADDPEYQAAEDAANEAAKPILDALESIGANVETLASEMGKMRRRIDVLEALLEDANQTSMGLLKVGLAHEFSMWRGIAATDPKCANLSPERREELAARFAFDQFASRMPESFRSKLETGRESIVETMLAEAGTELKIN
jgi:hypothetical protein